MLRFHCATCSDLGVRLTPISLCDMLRFMQLTTGGLVATIFGDPSVSKPSAIIAAILSAALFVISTYTKDTDYGKLAQQHKETASRLWSIRESYLSLLTDIRGNSITVDDVRLKRDELQKELEFDTQDY